MEQIEYLRECGVNYLRCPLQEMADYRIEMLLRNCPAGFLPVEKRRIDEEEWLYHKVNGLLSLYHRLEKEKLREDGLRGIMESIEQLCRSMEEYLLPFEGVVLNYEYVYVRPDSWQMCWIYDAAGEEGSAEEFIEYLLNHLDYEDQRAVRLLYAIYQTCRTIGGGIETIRDAWRREQDEISIQTEQKRQQEEQPKRQQKEQPKRQQGKVHEILREGKQWLQVARNKYTWKKERKIKSLYEKMENKTLPYQEEILAENDPGTTLLTGGMIQGGIYCLRARSKAYPDLLLTSYPFFVGKDESKMDGVVEDIFVSRYHARIDREEQVFRVMDLGSTNGTFLNRERLTPYEARVIQEGDILIFAHREYEFCYLQ